LSRRVTIVLAEDHAPLRYTLIEILKKEFVVLAEAADGEAAYSAVVEHQPEIALLDISMPGMSGIAVARRLREDNSEVKIVFLTGTSGREYQAEARRLGAKGYILKGQLHSELMPALRMIADGGTHFSEDAGKALQ
jgi:DNA-binding NarL/FixJ family response regulator